MLGSPVISPLLLDCVHRLPGKQKAADLCPGSASRSRGFFRTRPDPPSVHVPVRQLPALAAGEIRLLNALWPCVVRRMQGAQVRKVLGVAEQLAQ